ncbi:MAG: hypothetical protein ABIY70_06860 [Capsulimonas sp.]|uniref:hypothetical protein n=1 Tax=Capsulimonas sp. TaxID=2494211 RepID=UPI003267FAC0
MITSPTNPDLPFVSLLAEATEYFYCFRDYWDPISQDVAMVWKSPRGKSYRLCAVINEREIRNKTRVKPIIRERIEETVFQELMAAVELSGIFELKPVEDLSIMSHITVFVALRFADGRTSQTFIPGRYSNDERTREIPGLTQKCAPELFPKIKEEKWRKRGPKPR